MGIRELAAVRRPGRVIGLACVSLFAVGASEVAASVARRPSGFASAPQSEPARWLDSHGFRYGVGDYWTTQMITAITRGRVLADPVAFDGRRLVPFRWISNVSRVDRNQAPQFMIYQSHNLFGITPARVKASFGAARKIYLVGDFVVVQLAAPGAPHP